MPTAMPERNQDGPTEAELKLKLPPNGRERLERHPVFAPPRASPPQRRHEVTTYFDTPDHALAAKGITLRVRRAGTQRVQTAKLTGDGGAVAMRRGLLE